MIGDGSDWSEQVRLSAVEKLEGLSEDLEQFIKSFIGATASPQKGAAASASVGERSMGLGGAPPCSTYKDC
jgi:hypothetical protein